MNEGGLVTGGGVNEGQGEGKSIGPARFSLRTLL
jgi:hypothetical protein